MRSAIWKFTFKDFTASETFNAPWVVGGIKTVQLQNGVITMWAEVLPDSPEKWNKKFVVVGTGHKYDSKGLQFIGTVQQGAFVWHVFEVRA